MWVLTMSSEEYGVEEFKYDTRRKAEAGKKRIKERAAILADGVKRTFEIHREVTE